MANKLSNALWQETSRKRSEIRILTPGIVDAQCTQPNWLVEVNKPSHLKGPAWVIGKLLLPDTFVSEPSRETWIGDIKWLHNATKVTIRNNRVIITKRNGRKIDLGLFTTVKRTIRKAWKEWVNQHNLELKRDPKIFAAHKEDLADERAAKRKARRGAKR